MNFATALMGGLVAAALGAAALGADAPAFDEPVPPAWFHDVAVLEVQYNLLQALPVQPVWSRKPARKARVPGAAPAAGGGIGAWSGRGVSLVLAQDKAETTAVAESAKLRLALPDMSMDAALTAGLGQDGSQSDLWHRRGLSVAVNWNNAPGGAKVALSGSDDSSLSVGEPARLSGERRVLGRETTAMAFSATLSPLENVGLEFGATGSSETTRDSTPANRREAIVGSVETEGRALYAKASWQPVPWLKLEAAGREAGAGIAWRSNSAKTDEASGFAPQLALTLDVAETRLVTSLERTPPRFDTDAFVAYARVASAGETIPAIPDRAWRFRAEMRRGFGAAEVTAVYTVARDGTATEFGFARSGAQVPVSTPLEEAEEVKLGLSLPLSDFGFYGTALSGGAEWRDSSLRDPVTGAYRRASGEVPAKMTLKLERRLPQRDLLVGLTGEVESGPVSYQNGRISAIDDGGRFGAYLAFAPGDYEMRLTMDGLGAPGSTDTLFRTTRADPLFPRSVERPSPGPTVKLTLKRAM